MHDYLHICMCLLLHYALIFYSLEAHTVSLIVYSVSLENLMMMLMMTLLEELKMPGLLVVL